MSPSSDRETSGICVVAQSLIDRSRVHRWISSRALGRSRREILGGLPETSNFYSHPGRAGGSPADASADGTTPESGLTDSARDEPTRPPVRRFFSDDEKRVFALKSDQPGVSISGVARKHWIVTGMLFRWRVQFDVAQKKRAKLASVTLPDDTPATLALQKLVQLSLAANESGTAIMLHRRHRHCRFLHKPDYAHPFE